MLCIVMLCTCRLCDIAVMYCMQCYVLLCYVLVDYVISLYAPHCTEESDIHIVESTVKSLLKTRAELTNKEVPVL